MKKSQPFDTGCPGARPSRAQQAPSSAAGSTVPEPLPIGSCCAGDGRASGALRTVARWSSGAALLGGALAAQASTDYGPAIWRPCYPSHLYYSGYGHKFVVIHDMEGYYLSSISFFQRSTTQASVHYFANGKKDYTSDSPAGEISQGVREAYYAWHVRCWNLHCLGTEHEGFASNPAWYTEAMYQSSADLQRHLCNKFGIAKDRNHVVGHNEWQHSAWRSYASSHFGIDVWCNSHTDPGPYWSWSHFMNLINQVDETPSAPSSLAARTYSSSRIDLSWHDNSGKESGFKVERATASGGPWSQIGTTSANDVTFSATGLGSGSKYYFRVRAYSSAGNSDYSNIASATTKDVPPGAPSGLTATAVSNDQINLAWSQGSGSEDGFKIERSADGVNFTQITTVGINVSSYSNTGLLGNTRYYYRVRSYNTAGNSGYSNVANDITAPQAPSTLAATAPAYNQIDLTWKDNSSSEAGFKIERAAASAGPWTQIATNAASDPTYSDTGRSALTTYYYRVRSYNSNGNSDYSNVASVQTPDAPPVLGAIGNKSVTAGNLLTFSATATDPNQVVTTTTWETFESYTNGTPNEWVMFKKPGNSGTTDQFIDTNAVDSTSVTTSFPTGHSSAKVMKVQWSFLTGQVNPWVRLNTFNTAQVPNPVIDGAQMLRFDIYSTKALKVGLGCRETATTAAYGANGGSTGTIDWAGVTNVVSGNPIPSHQIAASTWTTLSLNIPFEPQAAFTGNGAITNAKVVLEHLALAAVNNASGAYTVYLDNFAVVAQNTLTYSLDAGAPSGASINSKTGKFTWTPTAAQAGANYRITVRVTDQFGIADFETITVTVNSTGNSPPVLAAIGNKTVNEGVALTFTATATDIDAGRTRTFSLDAGAPTGAGINPTTGAFTWMPTEAQGPGSYQITVRVTDNGSPVLGDYETITVTVKEVNQAPILAAIADQAVNEGSALTFTASATDPDSPANAITYSLDPGAPAGASINASTGAFTWTPTEDQGPDVYPITVRATDNGSPSLYSTRTFLVTVNEMNRAPVLTINNTVTTVTTFADFETLSDGTYNGTVMFRQPPFSSTTSALIDTNIANLTSVVSNFPAGNLSTRALYATWQFKSGTSNQWVRLTTFNSSTLPNPTVNFGQRVRFDVYCDKALRVGLGLRETSTGAGIGANGGATGTIEYVGVTNVISSRPQPTRTVPAGTWTTLEFNVPSEPVTPFTGDGVLTSSTSKGALESIELVPVSGLGPYNVYLDNFASVNVTTNTMVNPGDTFTITCTATDPDAPSQNLTFSLDAGAPDDAAIDPDTGVFTWTPSNQSPRTNYITVRVTDDGPGNFSDAKTFLVVVNKINTAPRLAAFPDQGVEVTSGGTVSLTAMAEDDDVPADALTFNLTGIVPAGASINPSTGDFTWTPPSGQLGTNFVTVRVTDNGVPPLYDEQDLMIIVTPTNAAPTLAAIPDFVVHAGETVSFTASATDPDLPAQPLAFALDADAPTNASIDSVSGLFVWITGEADAGTNAITVFVEDDPDNGAPSKTDSKTFNVVVIPPDHLAHLARAAGNTLTLTWSAVVGANYRVQYKTDLAVPDWTDLTDTPASSPTVSLMVTNDAAQKFFRIVQLPPP